MEATLMDRRWQLVLDCLDIDQAPFSKGTFVAFRKRLIDAQMDRRLIERTIELANQTQEFGPRGLRAALGSSPLWGAGRAQSGRLVAHLPVSGAGAGLPEGRARPQGSATRGPQPGPAHLWVYDPGARREGKGSVTTRGQIAGSPEEVARQLAEVVRHGFTFLNLWPVGETATQRALLAREVLPIVRDLLATSSSIYPNYP